MATPAKKMKRSAIWKYFEDKGKPETAAAAAGNAGESETYQVKCNICKTSVSNKLGNTSNCRHHLKNHHPSEFSKLIDEECASSKSKTVQVDAKSQPTITHMFSKHQPFDKDSQQHKKITSAITRFITADALPTSLVEKSGFKQLMHVATEGRYVVPSRNYFQQTAISALYNSVKENLVAKLKTIQYYSCTTDLWSSITKEPYLSLTIHYVDDDWCLKSHNLSTYFIPDDHTGENIAAAVNDCLLLWNLDLDRMVALTTDSASSMKLAVSTLNKSRVPCFGHILNNAVEHSLSTETVNDAFKACKSTAAVFSYSWKKKRDLIKAQAKLELPTKTMPSYCKTRWSSKHELMTFIIEQELALRDVLKDTRNLPLPSHDQFQVNNDMAICGFM